MDLYLVWFDDDRKKPTEDKLRDAMAAYQRRFNRHPNVVLLNERDTIGADAPIRLRPLSYIQPSMYYVGRDEAA